ncbi:MAG: hypothetical protein COV74_03210 [Candidatus Omnitrophica bacterium CG11_big_fil_rev_8_21_14_0_20_45_26]|uniref:Phytanoyl-CoA dioxygenase n=1 Tax=Candidatus Abzuiibacterium crystallinum TaxID=1974748 RepID=A0A2H0LT59_9BACT|nr:MAG: hypothetical protein COV74_03210 [Candidatus Omnitrophica bacterium CG11_big_fil_rev_8_21_14_0_20_45_26]PIW64684.1 MAG: hypothetical protein COW12_05235 [Candidatus Omnitrophica bacterium CG12_big_fil_rev_8_21_14_0_65_45_16]
MRLLHPLLGILMLDKEALTALQQAAEVLIHDSAPGMVMGDMPTFLKKVERGDMHIDATAGSIVKISVHNFVSYARFHQRVCKLLEQLKILDKVTSLSLVNFRLMSGKMPDKKNLNRPYATTKTHLDVWSGEPADIAHVWVALFGDVTNTTMELFEPPDAIFQEKWFKTLDQYDQGEKLPKMKQIKLKHQIGQVILFDGACPHKTSLLNGQPRVSFDVKLCRKKMAATQSFASAYVTTDQFEEIFNNGKIG